MRRVRLLWLALALFVTWPAGGEQAPPSPAAQSGDAATDELIAQEKIRAGFEAILENYLQPTPDGDERIDMAIRAVESLQILGPGVVPYIANELEQDRTGTLDLCSYALGMLNTKEAEAALQKAVARAEDNPGAAARASKAWASWGLGLQGKVLVAEGEPVESGLRCHQEYERVESDQSSDDGLGARRKRQGDPPALGPFGLRTTVGGHH